MTLPEGHISIEQKISDFKTYLDSTDRAILSANFGDGKSTFLNKFILQQDDYKTITIFPLHYQVADNKDIFEYIKRDILMQVLSYIELENSDYPENLFLYNYLSRNKLDLIDDLLEAIPKFQVAGLGTETVTNPLRILLKNIRKYRENKEQVKRLIEEAQIETFLSSFDDFKGSIYEFDAITRLICQVNKRIKEKEGKKLVLVIEDLDRMDPAHIFRILNIFSAHIDRVNGGLNELEATTENNKFNFDKVLLVCHYENIKSIFHHFYGADTDFVGYISKFSSLPPFKYSLKDGYKEYIMSLFDKELMNYSNVMSIVADLILSKELSSSKDNLGHSLRDIKELLNSKFRLIRDENIYIEVSSDYRKIKDQYYISSINSFTMLLDLLNRFSLNLEAVWKKCMDDDAKNELFKLVGVCWLVKTNTDDSITVNINDNSTEISTSKTGLFYTCKGLKTHKEEILEIGLDYHIVKDNDYMKDPYTHLSSIEKELKKSIVNHR